MYVEGFIPQNTLVTLMNFERLEYRRGVITHKPATSQTFNNANKVQNRNERNNFFKYFLGLKMAENQPLLVFFGRKHRKIPIRPSC